MKKEVSRQRRWQIRQKAAGRCALCGEKIYKGDRCERHYWRELVKKRANLRKKTGYREWKPGSRGRPPFKIPEGMK